MAKDINFHYECNEMRYSYGILDREFFSKFPDVKEEIQSSDGRPVPMGDIGNFLIFIGSAVLSSAAVAAAIKAWIEGRRRKIVISISGTEKKLEYEGPSLAHDANEIEAMIDKLANESPNNSLFVRAIELPELSKPEDASTNPGV